MRHGKVEHLLADLTELDAWRDEAAAGATPDDQIAHQRFEELIERPRADLRDASNSRGGAA